jgi:hypothetical protein
MSPTRSSNYAGHFCLTANIVARLAEMRRRLLLRTESDEVPEANGFESALRVAQRISARPSTASQARFQTTSGLPWTHELFQPLQRLIRSMLCLEDGSRASFVIERLKIAIQPALALAAPLSQKLRILERTGFILSDPNATVTHRCCREPLRPNVPSLPSWPTRPCDLMGLSILQLVPFGRVSLASVRV